MTALIESTPCPPTPATMMSYFISGSSHVLFLANRFETLANRDDHRQPSVLDFVAHQICELVGLLRVSLGHVAVFGIGAQAEDEKALVESMRRLLAVAEDYPDLKASEHYLALQKELANTEDRIQAARRFYNGNVRDLNTRIEVFPSNLIASIFNFAKEEYFEVESSVIRQVVDVNFPD